MTRLHCVLPALIAALVLVVTPSPSVAAWPNDSAVNLPVCTAAFGQIVPILITDGAGGAIVTWEDARNYTVTGTDIYAQHLMADGTADPTWPPNGRVLCAAAGSQESPTLLSDGNGGAIVTWVDLRSGSTGQDIYAQHVLASGAVDPVWPTDGRALCIAAGNQYWPQIATDVAGGAIVTWYDGRTAPLRVYAQHVIANGTLDPAWPTGGRAISTAAGEGVYPKILADGAGGAFVTWQDGRPGAYADDIYAQHVLPSGAVDPAWPINGLAVCTATSYQWGPTIIEDRTGGAIVAWYDHRSGTTLDIYAQHVRANGTVDPVWPADGRAVCTAAGDQAPTQMTSDGVGGAIVTWVDRRSDDGGNIYGGDIYAQHVLASGVADPAWPLDGRALCAGNGNQGNNTQGEQPIIATDGAGGAIVTWYDNRRGTDTDIYAQRISIAGVPEWTTDGVALCTAAGNQLFATIAVDGVGGAIVTWYDNRTSNYSDIYAQRVSANGQLGGTVDRAPTVTAPSPVIGDAGRTLSVEVNASDPDGDPVDGLSYVSADLPPLSELSFVVTTAGLTKTGKWTWRPGCSESGVFHVTFVGSNALSGSTTIEFRINQPPDTDGDGLPDTWETGGIDGDGDGIVDFVLPGANPLHKDIYVEVDAMTGFAPDAAALQDVVDAFAAAPVCNPDMTPGISLHIIGAGCTNPTPCVDESSLPAADWGEYGSDCLFWHTKIHPLKVQYFGKASEHDGSSRWASIAAARAQAVRYCIFGSSFTYAGSPPTGIAEPNGNDFVVTLNPSFFPLLSRPKWAGTFMHELGHSLGLLHGGADNSNYKPNYYSVMNYIWTWPAEVEVGAPLHDPTLHYRRSWRLDYSRSALNALREQSLNELSGIGGNAGLVVPIGPPKTQSPLIGPTYFRIVTMGGAVDWNSDGTADDPTVSLDINNFGIPNEPINANETLHPHEDWNGLQYRVIETWPPSTTCPLAAVTGVDVVDEMTQAIYDSLSSLRFDCNGNGIEDAEEIANGATADANDNGIPDPCEAPAILLAVESALPERPGLFIAPVRGGVAHEIRYSVATHARATLRVFDLAGRVVVTLADGDVAAGVHRVVWGHVDSDGQRVGSGVYFLELQSGSRRARGKIVVLR